MEVSEDSGMGSDRIRVGRFEIERKAGAGAMGTIFRALDTETSRPVAVKLIRDVGEAERSRFKREGRALAGLRHPGIVRYVDHGETGEGEVYLAMEWLEGEDLRARIGRAGLTVDETVTLGLRVAEALVALHAQGLVHRDVKPGNLFLVGGRVDDVRLIDFGLVRGSAAAELTRTGTVVGTPAYMSPEQARGQREVDGRSDLFSLGCVLFKCLTGRPPFEGSGVMVVLARMLLEEVPRARSLRGDVPPAVDAIVARLLSKSPEDRFQSALELLSTLEAMGSADVEGGRPSVAPSTRALGLTAGEQRVVAMVLVGAVAMEPRPDEGTMPAGSAPPDDVAARLAALARDHRGRVDQILDGTRIVTFSGASVATDQAARAAQCALAIRAILPGAPMAVATEWSELQASLPVGEAIERGVALLDRSARAVAVGEAAIAVDPVTAALLGPRFQVRAGPDGPELVGLGEVGSGARTLLGKPSVFVGREWEMSSMLTLLRGAVEESSPRAVLVSAPAGMGKSRLAHEIDAAVRRELPGVAVWTARGDSLRAGSPLGLLGRALRGACGATKGEPAEARRRLQEFVAARVPAPDARRVAAFVGEIVGEPFPDEASPELRAARADPAIMTEQLRRAWQELLAAVCAERPVLLILDDLQWGDRPTVRLVGEALRDLDRQPWMVLAFTRPEVHETFPRLWADRNLLEVRLKPMLRRPAEQLVRAALGEGASAETVARLVARAEGNAFYLEELVRAVAERGGSASDSFPGTVLAMAHARFESLDPDVRRLLRTASVFGEVFWERGVTALLGEDESPGGSAELLAARELVVRRASSRFAGEEELAFRHALVREAAYATLTPGDRELGHRLAGEWLEARGESDAMLLAKHFDLGGDPRRAARHYLGAARRALRAFDLDAAVERAGRALSTSLSDEERCAAAVVLVDVHAERFEWAAAMPHIETVLASAPPGSASFCRAVARRLIGALLLGRPHELASAAQTVLGLEPDDEAGGAAVQAIASSTAAICLLGQRETAAAMIRKLDALAVSREAGDPVVRGHWHLCHVYPELYGGSDVWAALRHAEAARAAFVEIADVRNAMSAQCFAAHARGRLGDFDRAERELRAVPSDGLNLVSATRDTHLMHLLIDRRRFDEARAHIDARILSARARGGPAAALVEAGARWVLGEIALRTGDAAAAEREILAALDGGLRTLILDLPAALAVLAAARLALGRPGEALASAREAMEALARTGTSGFREGAIHLVHAEALAAAGDRQAARAAVAEARDRLLALAQRVEDPALRRSYLEQIPEHARTLDLARAWLEAPA
jgi:hypothetical protein